MEFTLIKEKKLTGIIAGLVPGFDGTCQLEVWVWVFLLVVVLLAVTLLILLTCCCWSQLKRAGALLTEGYFALKCWLKNYDNI